jgi:hypothetical protein
MDINKWNQQCAARDAFAKKYPKFYAEVLKCVKNKEELEICVRSVVIEEYIKIYGTPENAYGRCMYQIDVNEALYINNDLDIYSSQDYDFPIDIWDKNGEPYLQPLEVITGPTIEFPFLRFLGLGEANGYEVTRHKSAYGAGSEIYDKISRMVKENAKDGYTSRLTEKQLLQNISQIISEVCEDTEGTLICSFQDDTDYGFTDSDSD